MYIVWPTGFKNGLRTPYKKSTIEQSLLGGKTGLTAGYCKTSSSTTTSIKLRKQQHILYYRDVKETWKELTMINFDKIQ